MFLFTLLEPISSLDYDGLALVSFRTNCALPVGAIGSAKLKIVRIAITVCKFGFPALGAPLYQLIGELTRAVFRSLVLDWRVCNGVFSEEEVSCSFLKRRSLIKIFNMLCTY